MKPLPQIPGYVFKFYCQKVLPAVYDDSLSYYEVLCKLTAKLNELISADMAQNDAIKELQNYFSSLEIEPAVLAGLRTLLASGDLGTILATYAALAKSFAFPTLADLKAATHLVAGTICQTLGKNDYKTGDGSFYYVRVKTNDDDPDDNLIVAFTHSYTPALIAEKIPDPVANDLSEVKTTVNGHTSDITNINNKFTNDVGDKNNLNTPTKTDIVAGINSAYTATTGDISEINQTLTTIRDDMGSKSQLQTTVVTNLVAAINSILTTNWSIDNGGTGASTAVDARENLGLYRYRKVFNRYTDLNTNWTITGIDLSAVDYLEIYYYYNPPGTDISLDNSLKIKMKDATVNTNLNYMYPYSSSSDKKIELATTNYSILYDPDLNSGTLTLTTGTRYISTITNNSIATVQSEYNQFNVYRVIAYQY